MNLDALTQTVNDFANKLGIEAVRLWPRIVFVHWLRALFAVIRGSLLTALATIGARITYNWALWAISHHTSGRYSYDDWITAYIFLAAVFGALAIIAVVGLICMLTEELPTLIDPEGSLVERKIGP